MTCSAETAVIAVMVAVVFGRALYLLLNNGARRNAVSKIRYIGFGFGYAALGATAVAVLLDSLRGLPVSGQSICFLIASVLLIVFRGGDAQKSAGDRMAEGFKPAKQFKWWWQ